MRKKKKKTTNRPPNSAEFYASVLEVWPDGRDPSKPRLSRCKPELTLTKPPQLDRISANRRRSFVSSLSLKGCFYLRSAPPLFRPPLLRCQPCCQLIWWCWSLRTDIYHRSFEIVGKRDLTWLLKMEAMMSVMMVLTTVTLLMLLMMKTAIMLVVRAITLTVETRVPLMMVNLKPPCC